MIRRPSILAALPAFLIGVAAATAAEVAGSLLLYSGPGFLRSLTAVLAVESAAFGLGLASAAPPRTEVLDSLRRRWLLCMVLFLGGTLYSASWSLVAEVGREGWSQGLGLAFLAALPLYGCGLLLGTMVGVDGGDGPRGEGAAAALGAAAGFVLTGWALPQILAPASLFLGSLVLLSAAGLFYGAMLDRRLQVREVARRPAGSVEVRVEERHRPASGWTLRLLLEGAWIRRWQVVEEGDDPRSVRPWDAIAWEAFRDLRSAGETEAPSLRVLHLGGGASSLAWTVVRSDTGVRVEVVERSEVVVEMAREHLGTRLEPGASDRIRVSTGNLEDLLHDLAPPYDLILVDLTALHAVGGSRGLSTRARGALAEAVAPGGLMVRGPVQSDPDGWPAPAGWVDRTVALEPSPAAELVQGEGDPVEAVRVVAPEPLPERFWTALAGRDPSDAAVSPP